MPAVVRIGRVVLFALVLALGLASAGPGAEARGRGSTIARAKRLFKLGQVQYRLGHFPRALEHFKASLKLVSRPSIIFNIAQCHRFMEQPKEALFFYKLYLSEWQRANPGTRPPNHDETQEFITRMQRQLEAQRSQGSLLLSNVPAKAQVRIDGNKVAIGSPGTPFELPPGKHEVEVTALGSRPWSRQIVVEPRQQIEHVVQLVPLAPRRSTFWLVSGISCAALALGAEGAALAFTVKTNNEYTDSDRFVRFRSAAIASHVVAGSLAVAAGISFLFYWRSGTPLARVGFLPQPDGSQLSLAFRF